MEDSLCDAEQRPIAQKVCGEEDADEGDSGDEGETSEPKVSQLFAFTLYLEKASLQLFYFSFPFKYHIGPWGGCSALCGDGGVRKREITCFKKDNGTVVALEDSE